MAIVHLVAKLNPSISSDILARWWRPRWIGLRRAFPRCLVAALRRDHGHLLVETEEPARAGRIFGNAVRCSTRGLGAGIWDVPDAPVMVRDRNHLYKTVRYILRNPLAEPGVDDPLRWLWSTLRDVVGATTDPWCSQKDLARVLGRSRAGFERWCLRWVTGEPGDHRELAPFPVSARPQAAPMVGLERILSAAAVATRDGRGDAQRKRQVRWLFMALARHQGWRDVEALAQVIGVHPRSVYRIGLNVPPPNLAAAALCLGDERLLEPLP